MPGKNSFHTCPAGMYQVSLRLAIVNRSHCRMYQLVPPPELRVGIYDLKFQARLQLVVS